MSFLQIQSTNPMFSYVIGKNPSTGMLVKPIRKGKAFGWYTRGREDTYNIFFKDSDTEVSYKTHPDEKFEYLNTTRYNSLMSVINMISSFLGATVTKNIEQDVPDYLNRLTINLVDVKDRYLKIFRSSFPDFTLEDEVITPNARRISIYTKRPVKDLLHYTNLFCLFNIVANPKEYLDINEDVIDKYMNFLQHLQVPYFMKYVFKANLLRSPKLFKKYQPTLEQTFPGSQEESISLTLGTTDMHRWEAIKSRVDLKNDIIDLGCGEGNYIQVLAKRQEASRYFAIDTDAKCLEDAFHRARKYQLDHVKCLKSFDELVSTEELSDNTELILVEVIEHMEKVEAQKLLAQIEMYSMIGRYHITTPNVRFNKFYGLQEGEFRHDDHKYEMTQEEFVEMIKNVFGDHFTTEFYGIGDRVNGEHSTLGCTITRK